MISACAYTYDIVYKFTLSFCQNKTAARPKWKGRGQRIYQIPDLVSAPFWVQFIGVESSGSSAAEDAESNAAATADQSADQSSGAGRDADSSGGNRRSMPRPIAAGRWQIPKTSSV